MKIRYESDDGKVSGYGDEGKQAVEEYEADPLARFNFPWKYCGAGVWVLADGAYPTAEQFTKMILLGSRLAPLVRELISHADHSWDDRWREQCADTSMGAVVRRIEVALNEALNA